MSLSEKVKKLDEQSKKYFFSVRHLKGGGNMRIALQHVLDEAKKIKADNANALLRSIKSNARLDQIIWQAQTELKNMGEHSAGG